MDYSCTLTPLFSIELLSNQSYILQLNFSPPRAKNGSDASDLDAFGITESPVVIKQAFLTLVVEDKGFHTAMFYLKCFCVPFILGGKSNFLARKGHCQKFLRTGTKFLLIAWFWVKYGVDMQYLPLFPILAKDFCSTL